MTDPGKEFSKVVRVMSADVDLSRLREAMTKAKLYGFLAVRENVPRFRKFIDGLDALTKSRIKSFGYDVY